MVQIVALVDESKLRRSFYVPEFEVRIEGVGLPRDVLRDVMQLTYRDSVAELDSFEMTVNNWDPATRRFKYAGSETAADLAGKTKLSPRYKLFEPCNKQVEIHMGYADHLQLMLTGSVTTMEPMFPSGGASVLTVRGLNVLHQLRRKPYSWAWENMTDSRIAKDLENLTDPDSHQKRFPLPIEIDRNAEAKEPELPYLAQQNQTDIEFLLMRARERGYVVYVKEPDRRRRKPKRLYFGPPDLGSGQALREVAFELEWGTSLVEFKPTLTTANQVRSITVRGWNRKTRKPIEEKADLTDPDLNRNADLHELLESCDPRDDVVVSMPVFTTKEAKRMAVDLLKQRQRGMVKASVTSVGLPDLRAGQLVLIRGLGARFSGIYFVTDTTHTIGENGYTTTFNAHREDEESKA